MAKAKRTKRQKTVKRPKWLLVIIIILALLFVCTIIFPDGKIAAADRAIDQFFLGLFRK